MHKDGSPIYKFSDWEMVRVGPGASLQPDEYQIDGNSCGVISLCQLWMMAIHGKIGTL